MQKSIPDIIIASIQLVKAMVKRYVLYSLTCVTIFVSI